MRCTLKTLKNQITDLFELFGPEAVEITLTVKRAEADGTASESTITFKGYSEA